MALHGHGWLSPRNNRLNRDNNTNMSMTSTSNTNLEMLSMLRKLPFKFEAIDRDKRNPSDSSILMVATEFGGMTVNDDDTKSSFVSQSSASVAPPSEKSKSINMTTPTKVPLAIRASPSPSTVSSKPLAAKSLASIAASSTVVFATDQPIANPNFSSVSLPSSSISSTISEATSSTVADATLSSSSISSSTSTTKAAPETMAMERPAQGWAMPVESLPFPPTTPSSSTYAWTQAILYSLTSPSLSSSSLDSMASRCDPSRASRANGSIRKRMDHSSVTRGKFEPTTSILAPVSISSLPPSTSSNQVLSPSLFVTITPNGHQHLIPSQTSSHITSATIQAIQPSLIWSPWSIPMSPPPSQIARQYYSSISSQILPSITGSGHPRNGPPTRHQVGNLLLQLPQFTALSNTSNNTITTAFTDTSVHGIPTGSGIAWPKQLIQLVVDYAIDERLIIMYNDTDPNELGYSMRLLHTSINALDLYPTSTATVSVPLPIASDVTFVMNTERDSTDDRAADTSRYKNHDNDQSSKDIYVVNTTITTTTLAPKSYMARSHHDSEGQPSQPRDLQYISHDMITRWSQWSHSPYVDKPTKMVESPSVVLHVPSRSLIMFAQSDRRVYQLKIETAASSSLSPSSSSSSIPTARWTMTSDEGDEAKESLSSMDIPVIPEHFPGGTTALKNDTVYLLARKLLSMHAHLGVSVFMG
jgi:hypothetical protein